MKKIYLITDHAKLDGVLDLTTNKNEALELFKSYHEGGKRGETNLIKVEFDSRIYDYDREHYKLNFFERIENNKEWATPYLDKSTLWNWGIYETTLKKAGRRF